MVVPNEHYVDLDLYIGDLIFIVGNKDDTKACDDVLVFADVIGLQEHLLKVESSLLDGMIVAYGHLTKAELLPSTLRNKNAYIITMDRFDQYGHIIECASGNVDDLADEIIDIMSPPANSTIVPQINDIFVLYGQQMDVKDGVGDGTDLIDEEITHECFKIVSELDTLEEIAKEQEN